LAMQRSIGATGGLRVRAGELVEEVCGQTQICLGEAVAPPRFPAVTVLAEADAKRYNSAARLIRVRWNSWVGPCVRSTAFV